jgi:hypothetical protein
VGSRFGIQIQTIFGTIQIRYPNSVSKSNNCFWDPDSVSRSQKQFKKIVFEIQIRYPHSKMIGGNFINFAKNDTSILLIIIKFISIWSFVFFLSKTKSILCEKLFYLSQSKKQKKSVFQCYINFQKIDKVIFELVARLRKSFYLFIED